MHKGFTVAYNHLNLPELITFGTNKTIAYLYDAAGKLLRKSVTNSGVTDITDYSGNYVYLNSSLQCLSTEVGRITPQASSFRYEYFLTDHLGNNRELFTDDNNDRIPELLQENHYYPFGMNMGGLSWQAANTENEIKLQGKELQKEFNLQWYNFEARFYDQVIGRWWVVDPLADQRSWVSPYSYCQNNPIGRIDSTGALDDLVITGDKADKAVAQMQSATTMTLTRDLIQGKLQRLEKLKRRMIRNYFPL